MPSPVSSIHDLLIELENMFQRAGCPNPALDAALLVREAGGLTAGFVLAHPEAAVTGPALERVRLLAGRRVLREPMSYLTGWREFWRDRFLVGPAVLIPRPETELLVEWGHELLKDRPSPALALDLATGSGCVGLSLLRENPGLRLVASDISAPALAIAWRNALQLGLAERFFPVRADGPDCFAAGCFDLVVCNPPYIPRSELELLQPEVRGYEPPSALDGGSDGLDFFRRWVPAVLNRLRPGGHLLMEFGFGQAVPLAGHLRQMGLEPSFRQDLQGIPRVFHLPRPAG